MMDLNKMRSKLLDDINKKHGANSMFIMGKRADVTEIQALSTGSLALDNAIGVGGFPRGRIVEIYGPESAGKSLILLSSIAQIQSNGGSAAFIDAEHALSPGFARLLGVDIMNLHYVQPDSGEKALMIMEELIASCLFDIVGLDSVAALVTEDELAAGYDDKKPAYTAIMMAKALKRMTAIISKTKTVAVFINQLRMKPMQRFGNPEYTTGGNALKFYSSLRVDVRCINKEKDKKNKQVAHSVRCKVVKNKVAPPFSECMIRLEYTTGIDKVVDVINTALELGVMTNASSWFYYRDEKWNGFDAVMNSMRTDPELQLLMITDIRSIMDGEHTREESKNKEEETKQGVGETEESVKK